MRTLNATQQALIDGGYKGEISWLFTVVTVGATTYRWSTKSKSFGGNTYSAKILPESFQGITLNRAKSELRIQAPNELTFSVTNSGSTLTASDFAGATVTVNLVMANAAYADTSIMTWKFRVKDGARGCRAAYQMLYFACEDFLQQYLRGSYPKGKKTRALSDSRTATPKDKACVPVIFGTAYIPIRSVYLNADAKRYYVLGPSGPTYTLTEVASPKEWKNQSTWVSASYTFTQYTKTLKGTSYRVVEPIIADSDANGTADACGLWKDGDYFLDMPCKFSQSGTSSLTSPEEIIEYLLEDFGVPSADIDTGVGSSFATAATTFAGWSLTLNGGLWKKELKPVILARVLSMCHAVLDVEDKIKLRVLSKTSKKTITSAMIAKKNDAGEGTFSTSALTPSGQDSGYILHVESGKPQDRPQEILVSALSAGTTDNISDETLDLSWVLDTQRAQRLGTLHFQRLLRQDSALSFEGHGTCSNLQPDDVISFADANYGGTYSALIDRITLLREGGVSIDAVRYADTLLDYSDLAPGAITYVDDGSSNIWNMVVTGPDGSASTGDGPNALKGRVRIGTGTQVIVLDNTDPSVKLFETATLRCAIGKIGAANYGVAFYDASGNETIAIDATRKIIKEMEYEIYTSGVIRTNANVAANGGWSVGPTQQIAYNSSGNKTFQVVFDGTDEGDVYFGRYDDGLCGLKIDMSANQAYFRGSLTLESLPGLPNAQYLYFNADLTEKYGLIVHDSGQQRAIGTGVGIVWTGQGVLGGCCVRFQVASTAYIDFGTNAAWDIYASGTMNMSWSFWIYITAAPATVQVPFSKGYGSASGWYFRVETDGKISLVVNKSGGYTVCSTTSAITYNAWNHLAFVYNYATSDAGTVDIYVNGVFDKTVSSVDTMASGSAYNLFLGKYTGATPYYFEGYLSSVKLYNRTAFSENNVRALYAMPQGARGGQLTARSVMVGTPSGSAPGVKIDDTGIWASGASGAELFGFSIIASGSVTWAGTALSAGHFKLGSATAYILYDGNMGIELPASSYFYISGGVVSISAGYISVATTRGIRCNSGSIRFDGGSLEIYSGTSTWSGGTINVSGSTLNFSSTGVININAAGGLAVGGSGTITLAEGGDIVLDTGVSDSAEIRWTSSGKIFARSSGNFEIENTAGSITIDGTSLALQVSGTNKITISTDVTTYVNILPSSGGSKNIGSASLYFQDVFAWEVNYNTIDAYPWDDEDDLALVRAIQPVKNADGTLWHDKNGFPAYDVKTFPSKLTNIEDLPALITEKYAVKDIAITAQDIADILDEKKTITLPDDFVIGRAEISKHIFTKASRMGSFELSVQRRLVAEIDALRAEIETLKAARLN